MSELGSNTDPDYTDITFVLDRSGSMDSIRQATIDGFAAFIAEQRGTPGRCTVTLNQFDDRFETVYTAVDLARVPALTLVPRGMTALLDAIGRSVHATGARLAAMPPARRPGTVIVAIMTDGLENASTEFTRPMIRKLITEHESVYSWTFLYMGAGQDAVEVGTGLGVDAGYSLTYDADGTDAALSATGANISMLRRSVAAGTPMAQARDSAQYTSAQRARAAGSTSSSKQVPRKPDRFRGGRGGPASV